MIKNKTDIVLGEMTVFSKKMMQRIIFIFSLMAVFIPQTAFAKRIALVIGNDAYANLPEHYQLKKARNDAEVTADTFAKLGFEVIKGLDLSRRDMNIRLARLVNKIEPGDEVFFFFAGHGVQIDGQNYLLPSDIPSIEGASEDLIKFESVRVDQITNRMRRQGARLSILVIDACRNNPYENTKGRSIGGTRGLASMEPPEGTLVLFSAGAGQAALDRLGDDDRHPNSIFTRKFLPLVETKGLELSQLARKLKSEVRSLARTVGHKQTPAVYNEVIGNVYLSGKGEALAKKIITKPPSSSTSAEETLWQAIKKSKKISDFEFYLKEYPAGRYSSVAKLIVRNLKSSQEQDVAIGVFPKEKDNRAVHEKPAGLFSRGWHQQAGDFANHRFSPLKQINAGNVHKLKQVWNASTGVLRGHEGSPLVVDGLMYVHTPFPHNVYAMDVKTGVMRWSYTPRIDPAVISMMCCDTVNRGLAYGEGKIFLYQSDAKLIALDAKTGKRIWVVANGAYKRAELGHGAPLVVKDKVIVGIRGDEFGVHGHITAYSIRDGRKLWRGYSMGPDQLMLFDPRRTTHLGKPVGRDSGLKSWQGDQWTIGGGTTWGWFSYDPDLNLVYYGTSSPGPWNSVQRPGDNRWSNAIIARDADTGVAKWVYQITAHDEWNYDSTGEMILSDLVIKGQRRKALVHFDSNGFAYTLDRATGELLVAEKFNKHVNWASKINLGTGLPHRNPRFSPDQNGEDVNTRGICPSSAGAKNSQPAAYSPETGLFYVPTTNLCMDYEPFRVSFVSGQPYVGADISMYPPTGETHKGQFVAFDASRGRIVWSIDHQFPVWSGALATAGGVVFYGTMKGELVAVDAKTGKQLFKFTTSSGIVGNVMTYAYEGKQYIAVYSGVGSWAGIGLAAGLTDPSSGLGMVGAMADLRKYTRLGGQVVVLALP